MNNGWQRVQTAFTLEEDAEVEIRIEASGISGNAWADCLQLEEGILANPYNILEDGSFELSEDIPYQSDPRPLKSDKKLIQNEVTDSISTDGNHSYHIIAEAASSKSFSFRTEVGSESSSYILSGWYKSTLTPERNKKDTENGRYLLASAHYHGTDTADSVPGNRPGRLQQFYWLPSWPDGWTYFSFPLEKGAWNELRLTIKVQGLEGDLYLDGMQLVKNEVQTRKYTSTGKLTSQTVQAKTSTYTYDYERLRTEKTPGGNVSTYTYDNISSDVKQVTRSVARAIIIPTTSMGIQSPNRYTSRDRSSIPGHFIQKTETSGQGPRIPAETKARQNTIRTPDFCCHRQIRTETRQLIHTMKNSC